jgi:hypothetical protein
VRRVPADHDAARRRLELAELNVARATREQAAGDADAALIFAEQALINAADALLARDGYGANSHVVRFSPRLPAVYVSERGVIDRIRSARNTAQYDAREASPPVSRPRRSSLLNARSARCAPISRPLPFASPS